jgi:hypothetical protein
MKHLRTLLVGVGLIVVGGAIAAQAGSGKLLSVTLFAPHLHGDHFNCSAVNVSDRPLSIAFAILGSDGKPLCDIPGACSPNPTSKASVPPGTELDLDLILSSTDDAYCEVTVSGTDSRDDVRVGFDMSQTRTIPGTTIPVFVFRSHEGH